MEDITGVELRILRYFVAVAEELHFGRAARRVGIAQPPLSQQIRRFERRLGVKLLRRDRRHVELTPAGRMFLEAARALLAQAEQAVVAVRRAAQGQTGLLRAAIDPAATYHDAVPAALRRFRERSPMVQVSLRECRSADQVAMLRRGEIEIGFVCTPVEHEGVVLETVISEPLMLALPEMHALSRVPAARLALLSGDRWIMPERDAAPGIYDTIVRFCMDAGFSPVAGAEAGRTETAVALVAAGLGVALVPGPAERLARAGVWFVPTHEQPQRIEIAAAHLAGSESPVVPVFLEILRSKEKN